ncbi:MAG: ferredoxin, partial [Limnochordia bacterium]
MEKGLIPSEVAEARAVMAVAEKMLVAARTAPKARGRDNLVTAIVTPGPLLEQLRGKMRELGPQSGFGAFERDAENIAQVQAIVLLGTKAA